jgi:PhnB protein
MTTTVNPYVTLDGNCEEAMKFWAEALGAKLEILRMGDSPMPVPPEAKNRVMHSTLKTESLEILASDGMMGQPVDLRGPISICLNFTDKGEQTRVWDRLSAGGSVTMPLADQFWGRFGMLTDKFGIKWMLSHHQPESQ